MRYCPGEARADRADWSGAGEKTRQANLFFISFALEAKPSPSQESPEPCAATRKAGLPLTQCRKYATPLEKRLSYSPYCQPSSMLGQYSICFARPAYIDPSLHTLLKLERLPSPNNPPHCSRR